MLKKLLKPIIEEAYRDGYEKCLTDIVERAQFIYEVIAEKARMEIFDEEGAIPIEEVIEEEWGDVDA